MYLYGIYCDQTHHDFLLPRPTPQAPFLSPRPCSYPHNLTEGNHSRHGSMTVTAMPRRKTAELLKSHWFLTNLSLKGKVLGRWISTFHTRKCAVRHVGESKLVSLIVPHFLYYHVGMAVAAKNPTADYAKVGGCWGQVLQSYPSPAPKADYAKVGGSWGQVLQSFLSPVPKADHAEVGVHWGRVLQSYPSPASHNENQI